MADQLESRRFKEHATRRQILKGAGWGAGALVFGGGLVGIMGACSNTVSPSPGTGKSGGTLVFGLSSYPPSLDPFLNTGTAASTVRLAVYRGLLGYDTKGDFTPEVAESYTEDGDIGYTFKLRKNAKFHNGDPVTAEDVVYTLQRIAAPDSKAFLADTLRSVSVIQATDDHTVKITLKAPNAAFLSNLATQYAPIISKKATASDPDHWVGVGPFEIRTVEKGTKIEVVKDPNYYKTGLPRLDGIRFVAYADDNLRVTALKAGDVDLIEYVPWQDFDSIQKNSKLKLDSINGPFMYLTFNATKGPFANAQVRDAVGYAIDRNDILQTAFSGQGAPLNGMPIPPANPYFDQQLANHWSFDPDRAKKLLAAAGYANGFSTTLLSTAQYGFHKDTAIVVQENLAKIGVKVELKLPDWPTHISLGNKGEYDFAVNGTAGNYNDPDFLSLLVEGGPSYSRSYGLNDATLNALLAKGRATLDATKRKEVYQQFQEAALKTVPLVGLTWRSQAYAMQKYVENFHNLPGFLSFLSGYSFDDVSLDK